ncbi:MAG: hypothetical protein IJN04_06150 [Clostridia bacterium]|nr:hypothetical protein [Clostridia bacterium]
MTLYVTKMAADTGETVLGVLLIITMLAVVAFIIALPWIEWFRQELKFINIEIDRHKDNPREQNRWKRRKKRLLRSLIPGFKYE